MQHEIKELRVILKEHHGFSIAVRISEEPPPLVDRQVSAAQVDPISIYGISDRTDVHVRHTAAGKVIPGIAILFPADIHYTPTAINRNNVICKVNTVFTFLFLRPLTLNYTFLFAETMIP